MKFITLRQLVRSSVARMRQAQWDNEERKETISHIWECMRINVHKVEILRYKSIVEIRTTRLRLDGKKKKRVDKVRAFIEINKERRNQKIT